MSTVGQQRSTIQSLANRLSWQSLKRAGIITRQSEGEHMIQMMHDAVKTLNDIPDKPAPATKEKSW